MNRLRLLGRVHVLRDVLPPLLSHLAASNLVICRTLVNHHPPSIDSRLVLPRKAATTKRNPGARLRRTPYHAYSNGRCAVGQAQDIRDLTLVIRPVRYVGNYWLDKYHMLFLNSFIPP